MEDTIAAISTPLGEGGIAVIRVSGPDSIKAVDKIFRGKVSLSTVESHTIHYGKIIDPKTGVPLDEVLVSIMRQPRTFTREDVVEVSCHGGLVSVKKVLDTILVQKVRLAEPGEFTKRAFLNGRIDLTQAEAVMDIIRAKTDRSLKVAMKQAEGAISKQVKKMRQTLLETLAHIEVTIDYPEHDVESLTYQFLTEKSRWVANELKRLLATADQGRILREGISTVIVGRPNVGKSSLLNALSHESRAIVTDIPGTTRDVIEEYVNIGGVPLRLIDTAGIRETEDVVERIGVERSKEALDRADLVLLLLNYGEALDETDRLLMGMIRDRSAIVVVNKTDLPRKIDMEEIYHYFNKKQVIFITLKEGADLDVLREKIEATYFSGGMEGEDLTYLSSSRHIALIKKALAKVEEAIEALEERIPVDMVGIDLRECWSILGEITGETVGDDLLDQIFKQFCLGK